MYPRPSGIAPRRVVITGSGIVTSLGIGWTDNARGFREGRRAFFPVTAFDPRRQRTRIAGEVQLPERLNFPNLPSRRAMRLDRAARMLLLAGIEAWDQSGWAAGPIPMVLGTTSGGMQWGEAYYRHALHHPTSQRGQPVRVASYQPQQQALALARALGTSGPITLIANACASGANAIGHAWELVRSGQAERALTGGYDGLSELVFAGFDSLMALSPDVCRPFDAHRNGLSLGEGAAVLCLESRESALSRRANILGEILGYGAGTDVHHLTQPHPKGDAALAAMEKACGVAGVRPEEIDYVNAHGTGTPLNDAAEAGAINRWAGDSVTQTRVSSTKAGIGHLLGAAGAVETVVCLMALQGQWLPPETTLREPDAACRFPIVREAADAVVRTVLTNSFGFGGANASLVLGRRE